MNTILILNPKGGAGKSTLSVNLAGFFACWGVSVTIADFDDQATSLDWLAARPANCPAIQGIAIKDKSLQLRVPTDYLILDVPSGHYRDDLIPWIQQADKIVVPVVPSPNDIRAASRFLNWIATDERMEKHTQSIAIVANRVRKSTRSFGLLKSFLSSAPIPCIGILRDTQNYVLASQYGLSVFELPHYKIKQELQQWQHIVNWLCIDPFIDSNVPIKPDQSVYDAIYGVASMS